MLVNRGTKASPACYPQTWIFPNKLDRDVMGLHKIPVLGSGSVRQWGCIQKQTKWIFINLKITAAAINRSVANYFNNHICLINCLRKKVKKLFDSRFFNADIFMVFVHFTDLNLWETQINIFHHFQTFFKSKLLIDWIKMNIIVRRSTDVNRTSSA